MGFQSIVHTKHGFSPVKWTSNKETVDYPTIIEPLLLQDHNQFLFIFPHVLTPYQLGVITMLQMQT